MEDKSQAGQVLGVAITLDILGIQVIIVTWTLVRTGVVSLSETILVVLLGNL